MKPLEELLRGTTSHYLNERAGIDTALVPRFTSYVYVS